MAADIQAEFGIDVDLIKGGGGIFDVMVDGNRVFSKKETGRFPEHEEILARLRT